MKAENLDWRTASQAADADRLAEPELAESGESHAAAPLWPEPEAPVRRDRATAPDWPSTAGPSNGAGTAGLAGTAGTNGAAAGPTRALARLASRLLSWPVELVKRVARVDFGPEHPTRHGAARNGAAPSLQDVDPGERPGRERQRVETMPRFPGDGQAGAAGRRSAANPANPATTADSARPARTATATDTALDSQPDLGHRARHLTARTVHVATEPRHTPARVLDTPFAPPDGAVLTRHSAARSGDTRQEAAGRTWEGAQWEGAQWEGPVEDVAADRWPELPDDGGLWVAPAPAFATDRVRRLEREQRGW